MKKRFIFFLLVIFGVIIISLSVFSINKIVVKNEKNELEKIQNITLQEISKYCDYLDSKAKYSICETCSWGEYVLVNNLSESKIPNTAGIYMITKFENEYRVEAILNTIYGRNTRTSSSTISFIIKKDGTIIGPNYPEKTCLD